jgi:recombination protein RecA
MAAKKKTDEPAIEVTDYKSKIEACQQLIAKINKDYKREVILEHVPTTRERGVISTRIPSLDIALGVGGFPRGRLIEIWGPERVGKTTIALQAVAVCLSQGGTVLYIDSEHSVDPEYCAALGIDVDEPGFMVVQPVTAVYGC